MEPNPTLRAELFAVDDRDGGRVGDFLWEQVRTLWAKRWVLIGVTAVAAVVATVVLLMIPNEYRASARVLAPDSGGNPLTALMGRNISSAATALLGGSTGEYTRYLTLLTSRSLREEVVDRFDLVQVYELEDAEHPRQAAIAELGRRTAFPVDLEFEYLSVSVLDRDPQRAADMANFIVAELNRRNAALSSQNASSFRRYVEGRYATSLATVDSLFDASQQFQSRYGVYDVTAQTQAFFEQMGQLGSDLARREVEYEAMRRQYGEDNPRVASYAQALASARRMYAQAVRGESDLLPVPQDEMPAVVRQYLTLERDLLIERALLEGIGPMLETARMQEEQQSEALQVVDPAVAPTRKESPRRTVLLIVATLSAALVTSALILALAAWRRHGPSLRARMAAPHA